MLQTIKNPEKLSHLTIQTCLIAMFLSNISSPFLYKIGISATNKVGPTGCKILLQVKCKATLSVVFEALSDGHFCVWWSLFLETTRVLVVEPVVINWEENNFIIYQDLPRWSIFQLSCSHQHNPRSMLTKQWGVLFHQTEGQKQKSNKNCGLGNTALPPCYWQRTCTNSVWIDNQDIT